MPFDGGSWGIFDGGSLIVISLIFDFELMGISLISWGRIFLGREPILINSIFLKPFE